MKFGLIGTGRWGRNYLRAIKSVDGSEVVMACSRDAIKYLGVPTEISVPWTDKYEEVLNSGIDTVIIATHPDAHFDIAYKALSQGVNVICEKPCMLSDRQYYELLELTRGYRPFFFTNYINQFASKNALIKESIWKNDFSILELVNIGAGPHRAYSSLWDYGCHEIFLALYLNQMVDYEIKHFFRRNERYHLVLEFQKSLVNITTGSGFTKRIKSITCHNQDTISWLDKKDENLLSQVLYRASQNNLFTNLMTSMSIDRIIKKVSA